jgi:hypothetical protein
MHNTEHREFHRVPPVRWALEAARMARCHRTAGTHDTGRDTRETVFTSHVFLAEDDHKVTAISLPIVLGVRMVRRCCSRSRPWACRATTRRLPRRSDRPRALLAPTFRIADSPNPMMPVRATFRAQKPRWQWPASDRQYGCQKNMYLIRMCWLRGAGTAKTDRDRGRSRNEEPRKPLPSARSSGFIRGNRGFPGPPLPLGAIQR